MSSDGRLGAAAEGPGGEATKGPEPETSARPGSPTALEKRAAVEQALSSLAFERADQLRHFLRYVCDMELAGRGSELNEHLIGVEALGRPPSYSTTDDSSVRRCAHALRQKLEEAYAGELASSTIRIELPRGGYQPRFHYSATTRPAPGVPATTPKGTGVRSRASILSVLAIFVLGLAAGAASVRFWPAPAAAAADPILAEAWGPLGVRGANTLICLSAPAHYGILPYPDGPLPPKVSFLPPDPELLAWWERHYPLQPGQRLASHLTSGPVRLGEVMGLVAAMRTLHRMGVEPEVVTEKNAMLPALRGRSVLLFGNPEYSRATASLLAGTPLTVDYDPSYRDRVVRSNGTTARLFKPKRDAQGKLTDALGLITVLPSEGTSQKAALRTVVVSCTNAAGCQSALEFFSSPQSLRQFRARLVGEGLAGFPAAYQVVIRTQVFLGSQSISGAYEAHAVFQR